MKSSSEILSSINAYLDSLPYNRQPQSLYEPVRYVLSMGGKRIRPTLMLLAYNLYRDDTDTILPQACALETYHNYTLLHDDLMDNADVRRGHPTVHRRWNANVAILSGDSMLVMAYERMMSGSPKHLEEVLQLFTETALQIGEGQQYDMEFEQRNDVREEEYIEMIRLKTSVLLACALKMGALLADAPMADRKNLYAFGEKIGLAFQLQDDFLDVYGDEKVFGKAIGGDILCNKKTYMLINAYNRATAAQREELDRWVLAPCTDPAAKIKAVTNLYNEMHIDQLAVEKVRECFNASKQYLEAVGVEESRKAELKAYAEAMLKRKY